MKLNSEDRHVPHFWGCETNLNACDARGDRYFQLLASVVGTFAMPVTFFCIIVAPVVGTLVNLIVLFALVWYLWSALLPI